MATRVLFVEDEADIREVIGSGLKFLGMEVTSVSNAEDALKKLRFQTFDVILLDMSLPGMSGWDFVKKMQLGIHRDLPIIALTGAAGVGDEQKAYQAGCSGYIPKPCESNTVKRKIEQTLAKGKKL